MTKPPLIGFLYDIPGGDPKVFFRTLLYATGKRGHVVEHLWIRVRRNEPAQTFSYWDHGEAKALTPGGGIRVGKEGVVYNHHFTPPRDETAFQFLPGTYENEVYAKLVHRASPLRLYVLKVGLKEEHAQALRTKTAGVLFNWGPDAQWYHSHVMSAPNLGDGLNQ